MSKKSDVLAQDFADTAIMNARKSAVVVIEYRKNKQTIVEITSPLFIDTMRVYSQTMEAMSLREPCRAETTFFQTYQQCTIRLTAFADIGR